MEMTKTKGKGASNKLMTYRQLRLSAKFRKVSDMKDCDAEIHQ